VSGWPACRTLGVRPPIDSPFPAGGTGSLLKLPLMNRSVRG
jgi:hypothetical protein